jgi:hypothetical protein
MAQNTYGRAVDVPMTNKSGGSVALGDVVIYDSTTNDSFTTTTSAASLLAAGVAQETIASNGIGRIRTLGYTSLVNTSGSVTRLDFGATHTVAKQAADVGASRAAGTFIRFLSSGSTPDGIIYPVDLAGSALTNPMSAVGDIIQGTTAGAPAALAAPLAGKVLTGAGVTTSVAYKYPPGYEFDYVEFTSGVSITATTEATANTVVTGNAVTYDGSTIIMIDFQCTYTQPSGTNSLQFVLYDGGSSIGLIEFSSPSATGTGFPAQRMSRRLTPSAAAHTYSIRALTGGGTATVGAGAGGNGAYMPGFIRQTKVSGGA